MDNTQKRNYWLHRISHCMPVSYELLLKGYLTIGFRDFLKNESFLAHMTSDETNKWKIFEKENIELWGEKKYRTRYNLWRFLCCFDIDDYIIVPLWNTFSVYRVVEKPISIGDAVSKILDSEKGSFCDWDNNPVRVVGDGNRYISYTSEMDETIDLGFAIRVEPVEEGIERAKYAQNSLCSRLKIYQTNADISDLWVEIEDAITRHNTNNPISVYDEVRSSMSEIWKKAIENYIHDDQFEKLIACYFRSIGASETRILSKKSGEGNADGDVLARFDKLNLVIYVQAKHHKGKTDGWAIEQITKFQEQKQSEEYDNGQIIVSWVISAADRFTEKALDDAKKNNVRLIAGPEFRDMLIEAGISELKDDFHVETETDDVYSN